MKKQDVLKTVRLIVYVVLAAVSIAIVIVDRDIYHAIANDRNTRALCIILWVTLAISFVFSLLEFNFSAGAKKDFRELDYAVHTDTLSGIANRFSADSIIESYLDKPVPENFCAVMMDITNLSEVNELHGHLVGNSLIKDFAAILNEASQDLCYVARNGGNKFLAIFDNATEENIRSFSEKLQELIDRHNALAGTVSIRYRSGMAWHEPASADIKGVTDLIALANKRIYEDKL